MDLLFPSSSLPQRTIDKGLMKTGGIFKAKIIIMMMDWNTILLIRQSKQISYTFLITNANSVDTTEDINKYCMAGK